MPTPTTYTEGAFAAYLAATLDGLADVLGWNADDRHVREAVTDALLEYDESSIGSITGGTNIRRLRALGRRAIWRAVVQATANFYSLTDNGQKLERQQIHDHAVKALEMAETDCRAFGDDPSFVATLLTVERVRDPYVVIPDSERV